jgi:flagellin
MSKINTNMAAVTTLYHLTNKEGSMNKALERISSGLRLNHAVDDAAGASIVNRMTSQIKGLEAAIRNAADAISLTQTAEGSLEEVTQILHRMRELSVQAANGVYTGQDRQAINNEIVAMQNELQRIAESSTFNGVKMLNGDFQDTTFQVGFQPNDTATLSIEDVRPSGLGEYILTTSNIDASTVASKSSIGTNYSTTLTATEGLAATFSATSVLSNQLQTFVNANTAGSTNGGWSVGGTDAGLVSISSTGTVTFSSGIDYETKSSLSFDVVFTTASGDRFTDAVTINVTDDTATEAAQVEELALTFTPGGAAIAAGDTFVVTRGSETVTYTADATDVNGNANSIAAKVVAAINAANAAGTASFTAVQKTTGGASDHIIVITDDAPGATVANASFTATIASVASMTGTQSITTAGADTSATSTISNADRSASTANALTSILSVEESTQVIIYPLNIASPETTGVLSDTFKAFVAANPAPASQANGGFSLSGADAAKFEISQTGVIKSKAAIDFDNPGSAASSNKYDLSVTYTNGTSSLNEVIELNITNDANDANYVSAAAQPFLGTSKSAVASRISEVEDLTIFGNVGTKVIDINGGSSARDVVTAVNSVQGETGVYANAQTRFNITFPDQAEALSDTVSFKLFGKNGLEQVISGNVDLGVVNGRDASLRNLADAVNSASGATGVSAKVSTNGAVLTLISNEGYDIVIEGYAMSASTIDMNVSAADREFNSIGIKQAMREGSANNNSMRISGVVEFHSPYIFSVSTNATGNDGGGLFQQIPGAATLSSVADLNVLTVENAKRMLTAVDGALVRVDLERSDLGATMSRMEHTIANLSNINLNTKAARSRIQDADIAAETVELNRTQVLSQAAQAMLAQANRTSQSILSLLQG